MNDKNALVSAISLTDEILEMLEQGEFERVNELELQRKPLIEQAFKSSIEEIDLIKAHHLQNLNQQVIDRLNLFKQSIILQQERIRTASKATRAYLDNDSGPIKSVELGPIWITTQAPLNRLQFDLKIQCKKITFHRRKTGSLN
jgi:hypothetical protein